MRSDRWRWLRRGFAICAMLLTATPAANAQVPPPDDNTNHDTVLVQALRRQALQKAIGSYVNALTVMDASEPLARYEPGAYCPAVLGLSDAIDAKIAARMRQVADAAGVKPAPPGCKTSALVFFVDDKQGFIRQFQRLRPDYFKDPKGDLWSPPKEKGPATSWQLTQQIDPQGNAISRDMGGTRYVESVEGGGRITSMVTVAVAMSVVIIERNALVGLSTTQIADYALMRSLTDRGPRDMTDAKRFSILSVIDAPMGSETPASLTAWDLAYIKGRYAGDPRFFGTRQGTIIRQSIERAVTGKN